MPGNMSIGWLRYEVIWILAWIAYLSSYTTLCKSDGQQVGLSGQDWTSVSAEQFILPNHARNKGVLYIGSNERLRVKLDQFKHGRNLTIATIGGSISAGQNVLDGFALIWVYQAMALINATRTPTHGHINIANGAVPGTVSTYMSVCVKSHVPLDADIVLVEYAVNDPFNAPVDSDIRLSFERLIRKLLSFPNKPAVLLINSMHMPAPQLRYWMTSEKDFVDLALYYGLPTASVRACCHHLMLQGLPGFWVNTTRQARRQAKQDELKGLLFFFDPVHPDGNTGHRVIAELAYTIFEHTYRDLLLQPLSEQERTRAAQPLPPPMHPGNYESVSDNCLIGNRFQDSIVERQGFEWINEAPPDSRRPKWGYVATAPGSRLVMKVNSQAASGDSKAEVLIELAHLKSYEHMGRARLACDKGCKCEPLVLEAHHSERNSQTFLQHAYVSQAAECLVSVTVLPESSSGEHKFKVIGIMVSEVSGVHKGIQNVGAVEYVHDIASRTGKESRFDIRNHAKRL